MRVIGSQPLAFAHRPFEGGPGASLYVGGSASTINYRRNRILDSAQGLIANLDGKTDLGATSFPKSQAVAQVTAPTNEIDYTLPAELLDTEVWCQVRTFADDLENDSLYGVRRLTTDGSGDVVDSIKGRVAGVVAQVRDAGGMRLRFNYIVNPEGLQPTSFSVVKTAGGGAVATVTQNARLRQREYSMDVPGLADGVTYTFQIVGHSGAVNAVLESGIVFTAVGSMVGAVMTLTAEVN